MTKLQFIYLFIYLLYLTLVYKIVKNNSTNKYQQYQVYPIISVKLTLSWISSALLVWSVNQTSTKGNSVLTVFIIVKECGEIFITVQIVYSERN